MFNSKIKSMAAFAAVICLVCIASGQARLKGVNGTLWVTNKTLHNVVALDASDGTVLGTFPVGTAPIGIISPKNTGKVYVANEDSGNVSVIYKSSGAVSTINLGAGTKPHHVNASQDGSFVFVAEFGTNKVAMIDTATDQFVVLTASSSAAARTHAVWVGASGYLYAANTVANQIAVIEPFSNTIVREIAVGLNPSEVLVTSNEKLAYVSVRLENKLKVVDLESGTIIDEIVVGTQPDTLRLTPDGKTLVVTLRGSNPARIAIVDVFSELSVRTVDIFPGTTTGHHWISQNGKYSFVAVERPGSVAIIDNTTAQVVGSYIYPGPQTDSRPHGVFYEAERLGDDSDNDDRDTR